MEQADVILVNLEHIRESIGTCDEILYAYMLNKPIIGFFESEKELSQNNLIHIVHPWKYYQIDRIESGKDAMEKAMEYIKDFYG